MNIVISFLKRIFGFKPNKKKTSNNQTTKVKTKKSNLNEISLAVKPDEKSVNTNKSNKKRYYKKKTTTKDKSLEPKKEKKIESVKKTTKTEKNGTTKKRYYPKKRKSPSTIQPESRSDQ